MQKIIIDGGNKLSGALKLQGSKNSALPILAATVLAKKTCIIHNCPHLTDIYAALKILEYLGCKIKWEKNTLIINPESIVRSDIPDILMHEMRSSIAFLGPMLARMGEANLSMPGGCDIGLRPIDLHKSAMIALGADISDEHGKLKCKCKGRMKGCKINLKLPSVGATENIMVAAATAIGETTIINAAREPEIIDLASFLNKCGARIIGAGEGEITIIGVENLAGAEHTVIPDRIVAVTYMSAAAITGGNLLLKDVNPSHINPVMPVLEQMGCRIKTDKSEIYIKAPEKLMRFDSIKTMPYPGFPTDAQSIIMATASVAEGTSIITESIFENRYKNVPELIKMGANIRVENSVAIIEGVKRLEGAHVSSTDLRGGSSLVVAGLAAEGRTFIKGLQHIDRGCENIEGMLSCLGAKIRREECDEWEEDGSQ